MIAIFFVWLAGYVAYKKVQYDKIKKAQEFLRKHRPDIPDWSVSFVGENRFVISRFDELN